MPYISSHDAVKSITQNDLNKDNIPELGNLEKARGASYTQLYNKTLNLLLKNSKMKAQPGQSFRSKKRRETKRLIAFWERISLSGLHHALCYPQQIICIRKKNPAKRFYLFLFFNPFIFFHQKKYFFFC